MSRDPRERRAAAWYWLLAAAVVAYVALCAPLRDNLWVTDALEHQRALRVFAEEWPTPSNPTYAAAEPSVRYSPYTLALAGLVWAGVAPFDALTIGAIANTVLLWLAMWLLLGVAGATAAAPVVLLTMVGLYGAAPGYANSYALADLPWLQANPSALSFPLAILAMAVFFARCRHAARPWQLPAIVALSVVAMLSHGMTGVFGFLGLLACLAVAPAEQRVRRFLEVGGLAIATFLLCLLWPFYGFLDAVLSDQDRGHWYHVAVLPLSLGTWAPPALAVALCALGLRGRPLVRFAFAGAVLCFGAAGVAVVTHSPVLARQPIPGLLFAHLAAAAFLQQAGVFRPASWPGRLRAMASSGEAAARATLEVLAVAMLLYGLVPQAWHALHADHLLRTPLAIALGKEDRQLGLREKLTAVLEPVRGREVVLSDRVTNSSIPAYAGRIVACEYRELLVPGQSERIADLADFFAGSEARRAAVLERYDVRWILLNRLQLGRYAMDDLLEPDAVVRNVDDAFVLMDARRWLALRGFEAGSATR